MHRTSILTVLLSIIVIAVLGPVPCAAEDITLQKHPAHLVKAQQDGKRYWYDDQVSGEEAKALFQHFREKTDDPSAIIIAVPGSSGLFAVLSRDIDSAKAVYGRRMYLVQRRTDGFEVIDRTKGTRDSSLLWPVFFTGGGRTVILVDTAAKNFGWCLMVYEIADQRLAFLGTLDATIESGDDAIRLASFTSVKYVNGHWQVEFMRRLVLDRGDRKERTIEQKGKKPIAFELDGQQFIPKAGTYSVVPVGGI